MGKMEVPNKGKVYFTAQNSHVRFFDLEPSQLLGNLSVIADCSPEIISAILEYSQC